MPLNRGFVAPGSCPLTPRGGGRAFVSWCSRSRSRRRSGIRGLPQLSSTASSCRSPPRPPQSAGSSPWADDASGQLFYRASARRRALGPRRAVGPTGRGGACCEGSARSGWIEKSAQAGSTRQVAVRGARRWLVREPPASSRCKIAPAPAPRGATSPSSLASPLDRSIGARAHYTQTVYVW